MNTPADLIYVGGYRGAVFVLLVAGLVGAALYVWPGLDRRIRFILVAVAVVVFSLWLLSLVFGP
jgi:hypothetical protein